MYMCGLKSGIYKFICFWKCHFFKNLKSLGKQKYIILQHTLHHLAVIQVIDGIFRYKTEACILGGWGKVMDIDGKGLHYYLV